MRVDERLLWKFIDRDCTRAQVTAVRRAVATDPAVAQLYAELLGMHRQMVAHFARRVPLLPELEASEFVGAEGLSFAPAASPCLN